jgi:hypothetical protein
LANRLRITGLIRLSEAVRQELARPLSAAQRDKIKLRVAQSLQQVEQIARDAQIPLDRLPAPSRRAVEFLKSIDWENVRVDEASAIDAGHKRNITWPGLGRFVERTMERLASASSDADVESIRQAIERTSRQMEGTIARQKLSPDELTPVSRDLRGWMAFFARPENIAAYRRAAQLAHSALAPRLARRKRFPLPLHVHFRPMRGIYKLSATRRGSVLSLSPTAIAFDSGDFEKLATLIFDKSVKGEVVERMTSEGCQAIRAELESLSGLIEQTRGAFHDLSESFDRVNRDYFAGTMPRPRLTWNRSFTGRKFGHYDWILDTVMVTRTLDDSRVPAFVTDFIVYHELLHKKHGITWTNGRGYAHTAEFYREERAFKQYAEAEAMLEKLARSERVEVRDH